MARRPPVPLKVVCAIGTLAYNKAFTARDFYEYTGATQAALNRLRKRGLIKRVGQRSYYPTAQGWKVLDRSCRIKYGR